MSKKLLAGFVALLLSITACEPVIAVGWREVFFVFLLIVILFGPMLYRFVRRIDNFRRHQDKDK